MYVWFLLSFLKWAWDEMDSNLSGCCSMWIRTKLGTVLGGKPGMFQNQSRAMLLSVASWTILLAKMVRKIYLYHCRRIYFWFSFVLEETVEAVNYRCNSKVRTRQPTVYSTNYWSLTCCSIYTFLSHHHCLWRWKFSVQ